jgi:hypothetical protein
MRGAAFRACVAGILLALGQGSAAAEERYDHRGALGVTLAGGGGRKDLLGLSISDSGWRGEVEVGLTFAVTRAGSEVKVAGRLTLGGEVIDGSALAGFRSYFGYERWKTMLDLDLSVHFTPIFTIGPRLGFGVEYELLSVMGIFAQLGAQLGFGRGLRLSFDGMIGVQFRTYILEGD